MALGLGRDRRLADQLDDVLLDLRRDACGIDPVGDLGEQAKLDAVARLLGRRQDADRHPLASVVLREARGLERVLGEHGQRVVRRCPGKADGDVPACAVLVWATDVLDDGLLAGTGHAHDLTGSKLRFHRRERSASVDLFRAARLVRRAIFDYEDLTRSYRRLVQAVA